MKLPPFFACFSPQHFRLRNHPTKLDLDSYTRATSAVICSLSGCPDVVSIYTIGEVSALGFSDLDFIIVLKDHPSSVPDFEHRMRTAMAGHSSVIIHYPHILPESLFPSLPYLFPFFSLNCVYGKKIPLVTVPKNDQKLLSLIILHDYIDTHWPQEFLRLFLHRQRFQKGGFWSYAVNEATRVFRVPLGGKRDLPVRVTLCRLNSLKYPLQMISSLTGKKYQVWKRFVSDVHRLRTAWFSLPEPARLEKLVALLKTSLLFSIWLIAETDSLLKRHVRVRLPDAFYLNKDHATLYKDNKDDAPDPLGDALHWYQKTSEIVSILPKSFLPQKKLFMDVIHHMPSSPLTLDKTYHLLCMYRAQLIKQQIDFLNTYGFSFKPILRYDLLKTGRLRRVWRKISYGVRFHRLQDRFH